MKKNWPLTLALLFVVGICLTAQKPADLVGTWVGEATIPDMGPNELTLVLDLKDGKLAGHMTGQYGTLNEAPLSEITLEKDVFSFSAMAEGANGEVAVKFKMKISGDSMQGDLEIPDMGMAGSWVATKQ